jgi:hypothetical protein
MKCILVGYLYTTDLINAGKMERIKINVNQFHFKILILVAQSVCDRHIRLAFQMKICCQHHALLLMIYTRAFVLMRMITHADSTG